MNIQLWNIETFEHLNRTLMCWLDEDIAEGEKIKRIQKFDTTFNQNGEVRFQVNVKTDREFK